MNWLRKLGPPQAFAVDACGDERDELVLYQPYNGEAILIFTQPDYLILVAAICDGKFALFDTDTLELIPFG